MAAAEKHEKTYSYIILWVKNGVGFDFFKDKPCRLVVEFCKSVLASQPIMLCSAPNFGCCFSWRVEDNLVTRLYVNDESLTIRFEVQEGDGEEQTIGYVTTDLMTAECYEDLDCLIYECMELGGVTLASEAGVKPAVSILLTIQTEFCVNSDEFYYFAELTDEFLEEREQPSEIPSSGETKQGPSGLEQSKPAPMKLDSSRFHGLRPAVRDRDQPSDQSSSGGTKSGDASDTSAKASTEAEEELEESVPETMQYPEIEDVGEWEEDIAVQQYDSSSEWLTESSSQASSFSIPFPFEIVSAGHESQYDESEEDEYEGSQMYEDSPSSNKSRHSSPNSSSSSYSKDYKTEKKQETSELLAAVNQPPEEDLLSRTKARDTSQISDISQQESTEPKEELEGSITQTIKDPEIEDVGERKEDIAVQQPNLPSASSEKDPILSSQYLSSAELTTEWLPKISSQTSIGSPSQTVSEGHESHVSIIPSSRGESEEYEYKGSQTYEHSPSPKRSRHSSPKSSSSSYSKDYKTEKKQETSGPLPAVNQPSEEDLSSRTEARDTSQTSDISQQLQAVLLRSVIDAAQVPTCSLLASDKPAETTCKAGICAFLWYELMQKLRTMEITLGETHETAGSDYIVPEERPL